MRQRPAALGLAALVATICLWSAFALTTRLLGATTMTTVDGALVRFAVPAVVLAPWWARTAAAVRRERAGVIGLLLLAGLPHFLLFAWGARLTSAGLTGLLVPGTVPLFVTLLLAATGRPLPTGRRAAALVAIVAGVATTATLMGSASLPGILVLLASGLVWAAYTLGLARTGLDLAGVVLVISVPSSVGALVLLATGLMPSHLVTGTAAGHDIVLFALLLGVGTGLASTVCYATAVARLGGTLPAVAGAASPVLTALLAVPLLHEPVTPALACGLALIVAGVLGFNLTPPAGAPSALQRTVALVRRSPLPGVPAAPRRLT